MAVSGTCCATSYSLVCVGCVQLADRLASAKEKLKRTHTPEYLSSLEGSMGVDPALYKCKGNNYVAA